jgi:vancomycin aglycone glucosyltransferase
MRITFAPVGTWGDVLPSLEVASALRAAGHAVRVCTGRSFAQAVASRGLELADAGFDFARALEAADAADGGKGAALALARAAPELASKVRAAAADAQVLVGNSWQIVGPSAAEALGIAWRTLQLFPRRMGPDTDRTWALFHRAIAEVRRGLTLPAARDVSAHLVPDGRCALAYDPVLSGDPAAVGSCVPHREGPLDARVEAFLAKGPALYAGFGSMRVHQDAWLAGVVARAARRAGLRVIALRFGPEGDGEEDWLRLEEASHASLFRRVQVAVHHGGAGTTYEAARAGVPQVIVPHLFDQPFWGARVAALGLGPAPVPRQAVDEERLVEGIARAREAAGRCAAFAGGARARSGLETVARWLAA